MTKRAGDRVMAEVTECTPEDWEEFWQDAPASPHFHISEDGQVFAVAEATRPSVTGRPVSRWDGENVREYAEYVRAAENAAQQAELNAYLAAYEPTEGEQA